jgi:hypothetical protein
MDVVRLVPRFDEMVAIVNITVLLDSHAISAGRRVNAQRAKTGKIMSRPGLVSSLVHLHPVS